MIRFIALAIACISLFSATNAHATLIQIDVIGQNNSGSSDANAMLDQVVPVDQLVTFSVVLDIDANLKQSALPEGYLNAAGSASWSNPSDQTFGINGFGIGSKSSNGNVWVPFKEISQQQFNSITLEGLFLVINLGVNPFTSNDTLANLLLTSSTVADFGFSLYDEQNGVGRPGYFDIVSSNISEVKAVSEPQTLVLFLLSIMGVTLARIKKANR